MNQEATLIVTPRTRRKRSSRLPQRLGSGLLLGLSLLFSATLSAQVPVLSFGGDISADLTPPTYAEDASVVSIDPAALALLAPGEPLLINTGARNLRALEVVELSSFINGDYQVRAQGLDSGVFYSLTLTVGANNLFGYLSTSESSHQFYAVFKQGVYQGWMYQPRGLNVSDNAFANDYLIPEFRSSESIDRPVLELVPLPLRGEGGDDGGSDAEPANSAGIDASNFSIKQSFSRNPVFVGKEVEARVTFENTSGETHRGLAVEFYFMLENSRLLLAPDSCREQLSASLQEVLYCELGDFAPGESKSFVYVLGTSEESRPQIFSTALVGNLRQDSLINVVDDVRTDSDGDGISDFNERLLGTDANNPASVDRSNTVIDVMTLYTPAAAALYPHGVETRINQLIAVANQAYAHSGVGITLRPVYHGKVNYEETGMDESLDALIDKSDPAFAEVDSLRTRYGGDLVMLMQPLPEAAGRCGLAPVGGFNTNGDFSAPSERQFAYSVIAIDCPTDIVVAHEIGHNMGLTHSHIEDGTGGTFNFSTGYGVDSEFVTVMAYPGAFNNANRIALFSNPRLDCFGLPCGIDANQQFGADAAQSLNLVKYQVANYYPSRVPDLPRASVAKLDGTGTSARISLAASSDDGLTFTNRVTPVDAVDLVADIRVEAGHEGASGSFHVLIGGDAAGFLQLNANGELLPWNGEVGDLVPAAAPGPLLREQRLDILRDFKFDEALIGQSISVFVAYQVSASSELVYTAEPLTLRVEKAPALSPVAQFIQMLGLRAGIESF